MRRAAPSSELPLVCCVKTGDKYGPRYVTALRNGVARHLAAPHRFVCFTEQPVPGVTCLPLPADFPGWWAKIGLFKLGRRLIYFDLDVIPTGDLSPLLAIDRFTIIQDWWVPMFNSSVMVLTGDERHVHDRFDDAAMAACPYGDQQFITHQLPDADTFPADWFLSYKAHHCQDAVPPGARAVVFHGTPKPHECGGWVAAQWQSATD